MNYLVWVWPSPSNHWQWLHRFKVCINHQHFLWILLKWSPCVEGSFLMYRNLRTTALAGLSSMDFNFSWDEGNDKNVWLFGTLTQHLYINEDWRSFLCCITRQEPTNNQDQPPFKWMPHHVGVAGMGIHPLIESGEVLCNSLKRPYRPILSFWPNHGDAGHQDDPKDLCAVNTLWVQFTMKVLLTVPMSCSMLLMIYLDKPV